MRSLLVTGTAFLLLAAVVLPTQAGIITYNTGVTPGVLGESTVDNQGYKVVQNGGVEIGLRAKQRYPYPALEFNIVGDGMYHFDAGSYDDNGAKAFWNVDWSINSDHTGEANRNLADLTYSLAFSFDPDGSGTTLSNNYDPVHGLRGYDNDIGDNDGNLANFTTNPILILFGAPSAFDALDDYNVAQNSLNLAFTGLLPSFDPNAHGIYTISLTAFDNGSEIASNFIEVYVGDVAPEPVPEPASVVLLGMGAVGLAYGAARRRQRKQAPAETCN